MSPSHRHQTTILALIILIAAGYLGNYFNLSLFFGVDFIFGSIAVLLVVRFYGIAWGTLAAIISSTHTLFLWNQPYSAIIFTCEALFIGLLQRGKHQNIVLQDVIFWLIIGIPVGWLFYSQVLSLDKTQTWLLLLKQPTNGIFNALVVNLIVNYLPVHKWLSHSQVNSTLTLKQHFLNLLLAFIFFPALLLIVLDGNRAITHIQTEVKTELNFTAKYLSADLRNWHQQQVNLLSLLAQEAAASNMKFSPKLQQNIELMRQIFPYFQKLYVANTTGKVITSNPNNTNTLESTRDLGVVQPLQVMQTTLQPVVSNLQIDPVLHVPYIDLSVPVVAGDRFLGYVNGSLNLSNISKLLQRQLQQKQQITLVDSSNQIIVSSDSKQPPIQVFDRIKNGEIQQITDNSYLWLPPQGKKAKIVRWQKSFYVQETLIRDNLDWKLVVAIPIEPYITQLQDIYIDDLTFMLLTVLLAPIGGMCISYSLARPLIKLAKATNNLPLKLIEGKRINWSTSQIKEIKLLVGNFKSMALVLDEKFQEIKLVNQTLGQRVQQRTNQLLQANKILSHIVIKYQKTSAELADSEEKYRDLFENANDLIQSINQDATFIYVNRAWRETLGYSKAEIPALSIFNTIHPDSLDYYLEVFQRVMSGENVAQVEVAFITKDNTKILVEGSINCKLVDGKPVATRGIFRNITERKQAEAEIHYALEKERELIDLKSRFITTASHEFRTPLTVITMSVKLLEQFGNQAPEEKKRVYLERIQAATKRMTHLLDDVLLMGKAEAGKLNFNPALTDIEKFCQELVEEMQLSAGSKYAINFVNHCQDTSGYLDEELLRYILSNLLSNAIKYSPKGGEITFNLICTKSEVKFQIQDQGIGIPVADQEKLFNSFHRGSNVDHIPGTGLGMSIVKRCVDLHGGAIAVNSEVEVGTTFTVTLPLKQQVITNEKVALID